MVLFVASKPLRKVYKRLHPVSVQLRMIEMLPGNTEKFLPQYYIYNNMSTMLFLK